ncbi:hypothetical protein FHS19_001423 [Paenibacillus rhizosphaerae]|uniref:Nicotinate phosphoribosyltransferase C-terminal domain-containing protein n=1 Tax=Paenibacillus rhizosphaerae TaxID=297318 RepID=A0A839TN37_9BACL|nr:hypothetical protein [Paenibacillus rhizosphaerae]
MFHPVHTYIAKFVTDFEARELHHLVLDRGGLVYELPDLKGIRAFARDNLQVLWEEYQRILNPAEYPVNLSQACWDNKMRLIDEIQRDIQRQLQP